MSNNYGVFGNYFVNNFISGQVSDFNSNSIFENNIFTYICSGCYYNSVLKCINNCLFENNIFVNSFASYQCIYQNNVFNNNINVPNGLFGYYQNNIGYNNYPAVNQGDIFISYSGGGYSFSDNYHLKDPANYIGNDGTQVGIYGGLFPWKEGSVPINPHIISKTIGNSSNQNGDLPVNVTIKAQNN